MLNSLELFLNFSGSSFRLNKIKWHPVAKTLLFRGQPLQRLAAIFKDSFCKCHDLGGAVKAIAHGRFDPGRTFHNHKSIDSTDTDAKNPGENRVGKLRIRLKTHKHLRTKSTLDFRIEIQLTLDRCSNGPFTSEQIENQLSTHLVGLFRITSIVVIVSDK